MPAVRKTTHFTDGALFSSLSHPLFLVPLLVTSPWSLSLSPRPVPFPGSASRFCLARSIYRSDSRQRHSFLAQKCVSRTCTPPLHAKRCSDTGYSARKCVSLTEKPALPAKFCSDTVYSPQKSVSRTGWVQKSVWHGNSVSRAMQVGFVRQTSQQEPPCGISQKGKGCGQGGGRSRRP
jgi:hypothetical protein